MDRCLVQDGSEAVRVLAPGHVAIVVRLVPQDDLLHLHRVRPEGLLVVTGEEVAVTSPVIRARSGQSDSVMLVVVRQPPQEIQNFHFNSELLNRFDLVNICSGVKLAKCLRKSKLGEKFNKVLFLFSVFTLPES